MHEMREQNRCWRIVRIVRISLGGGLAVDDGERREEQQDGGRVHDLKWRNAHALEGGNARKRKCARKGSGNARKCSGNTRKGRGRTHKKAVTSDGRSLTMTESDAISEPVTKPMKIMLLHISRSIFCMSELSRFTISEKETRSRPCDQLLADPKQNPHRARTTTHGESRFFFSLPVRVVSKKVIGDRKTACAAARCSFRAAATCTKVLVVMCHHHHHHRHHHHHHHAYHHHHHDYVPSSSS